MRVNRVVGQRPHEGLGSDARYGSGAQPYHRPLLFAAAVGGPSVPATGGDGSGGGLSAEVRRLPPMTHYVLALYRKAPGRAEIPEAEAAEVQEAHLAHLRRLRESGATIATGPFEEETDLRGAIVFRTGSVDEAKRWMERDPAIVRGRLVIDFYTWFAPAGLDVAHEQGTTPDLDFTSD